MMHWRSSPGPDNQTAHGQREECSLERIKRSPLREVDSQSLASSGSTALCLTLLALKVLTPSVQTTMIQVIMLLITRVSLRNFIKTSHHTFRMPLQMTTGGQVSKNLYVFMPFYVFL